MTVTDAASQYNDTERLVMLEKELKNWRGPDGAKKEILDAAREKSEYICLEGIDSLPACLTLLPHLVVLDIRKNPNLQEIPEAVMRMPSLERISAQDCNLQSLPNNLGEAKKLMSLELSNNPNLREIPQSITELRKLTIVELEKCDLHSLPANFPGEKLQVLKLSHNPNLTSIPSSITDSKVLDELSLENCNLSSLPESIGSSRLYLKLHDNPRLDSLPANIDLRKSYITTRGTKIRLMERVLNEPTPKDLLSSQQKEFRQLDKRWKRVSAALNSQKKPINNRIRAAAEAEIDHCSMEASTTLRDPISRSQARSNWYKTKSLVHQWAHEGRPVDIEHLKIINATLGQGLHPFNDPHAYKKFQAQFGEFRKQSTAFPVNMASTYLLPTLPCYLTDEREIGPEMICFEEWFANESAKVNAGLARPEELAAGVYQRIISIHPFPDANGRTAALAADWVLLSHGRPPMARQKNAVTIFSSGSNPNHPSNALKAILDGQNDTLKIYEKHLGI